MVEPQDLPLAAPATNQVAGAMPKTEAL